MSSYKRKASPIYQFLRKSLVFFAQVSSFLPLPRDCVGWMMIDECVCVRSIFSVVFKSVRNKPEWTKNFLPVNISWNFYSLGPKQNFLMKVFFPKPEGRTTHHVKLSVFCWNIKQPMMWLPLNWCPFRQQSVNYVIKRCVSISCSYV